MTDSPTDNIAKNSIARNNIAKNTYWLLLAEFVSRVMVFFIVVALANHLGDAAYGELAYGFAIANLLVVLADFGLSTYIVKNLSRDLEKTRDTITSLLGIKLVLMVTTIVLLIGVGLLVSNIDVYLLIIGGSAIVLTNARTFAEAFFRAHQKMHFEALTKIIGGVLLSLILGLLVYSEADIHRIAEGYLLAAVLALGITLAIVYTTISSFSIRFAWRSFATTLKAAWPFAATLAINFLFNYMDSAMLGLMNYKTEVAWYTAAYKPIFFLTAIAGMIISAFFPVISQQYAKRSLSQLTSTVQKLLRINLLIAVPMAVGGTFIAHKLIALLYEPEYAPAALAFQILLWSTAGIYCWAVFGNSLQACDRQQIYMRGFMYGAALNIILNLLLIPSYTLYGAAFATVCTQLFLVAFMYYQFQKVTRVKLLGALYKPVIAALAMAIVLWLVQLQPLWIMLLLGSITYGSILLLIKGISIRELRDSILLWRK